MSGEQTIEQRAQGMGWKPLEQFKGDPAKWIPAETYVERGDNVLPILRQHNKQLEGEVETLRGQLTETQKAVSEGQEAIASLQEFFTEETARKVKEAKKGLALALKEARDNGDTEAEVELLEQIGELGTAEKAAEKRVTPTATPASQPPPVDPAFGVWMRENDWFGKDRRRTALMVEEAREMRADPANAGLVGKEFYEACAEKVDQFFSPNPRGTSKVSSGGAPPGSSGEGGGKSFSDLPQEAKDACHSMNGKLVGPNRAYKDVKAWEAAYAKTFFTTE